MILRSFLQASSKSSREIQFQAVKWLCEEMVIEAEISRSKRHYMTTFCRFFPSFQQFHFPSMGFFFFFAFFPRKHPSSSETWLCVIRQSCNKLASTNNEPMLILFFFFFLKELINFLRAWKCPGLINDVNAIGMLGWVACHWI